MSGLVAAKSKAALRERVDAGGPWWIEVSAMARVIVHARAAGVGSTFALGSTARTANSCGPSGSVP